MEVRKPFWTIWSFFRVDRPLGERVVRRLLIFTPTRDWAPPLGIVGFFFVLLGLLVERRRQPG